MSTMNTVGRPTAPNQVQTKPATLTGGRGLLQNEALIFEGDGWGKTGVDLPEGIDLRRRQVHPDAAAAGMGQAEIGPHPRR